MFNNVLTVTTECHLYRPLTFTSSFSSTKCPNPSYVHPASYLMCNGRFLPKLRKSGAARPFSIRLHDLHETTLPHNTQDQSGSHQSLKLVARVQSQVSPRGILVDKVVLLQCFFFSSSFSFLASIIPAILHAFSFVYQRRQLDLASDSVAK
jgi:hypothetical protein